MIKMNIKLTQVQLKHNAMIEQGISPQLMAMKRSTSRAKDKKAALRRGEFKHAASAAAFY
ncbi:MAG: hypothetical protein Q7S87_09095 [Agitococcus sp.]|nr:hypothetical protein [Agitococcus sp.]MDO9177057.1 hypothetical protein [Agitococcus sp.]